MNDVTIRVENLGKRYRIGGPQVEYRTIRESLIEAVQTPLRRLSSAVRGQPSAASDEILWALKDVSFEIQPGEVVGIIGCNGAGKTTLLKVLSGITEPTEGYVELHGRAGSLLEVGAGFHPELTGRENIYLNGAILGMRKAEIQRKFDEIVAFSEIERFLDTPVKHYSSGMYVRLGFSVAAHLEPEILLVDEVLAVGDVAFQKKCLGKMGDVTHDGRTVLFVSHNMVAIKSLCQRAIWLHNGQVEGEGEASRVVSDYLQSSVSPLVDQFWEDIETAPGNESVRLRRLSARPASGSPDESISMQTPLILEVEFWNLVPDARLHVTLHVRTEQQVVAFSTGTGTDDAWHNRPFPVGLFRSVGYIPANFLNSGIHHVTLLVIKDGSQIIYEQDGALSFEVLDLGKRQGSWFGREPGAVRPRFKWTTELVEGLELDEK